MKTIGLFSKLGMPGGSENRVTQLANSFCQRMTTYIFAEKEFSPKLKPQLDPRVILREQTVNTKRHIYELQGVDMLVVVNSDSYSFCKKSYWDGTQGKHHKNNIDISQIPSVSFLFNYVVSPAQWLANSDEKHKDPWKGLCEANPNLKVLCTSKWFIKNLETEKKFKRFRKLNIPTIDINSPVSPTYDLSKTPSDKIRINRHSMAFAYKHDEDNLHIVDELCKKYGDKISFKWMGVPSHVRDTNSSDKHAKVPYRSILEKHPQVEIIKEYSISVPELLKETDILFFDISRTRKEPWPRTIAEGMMGGCCCVTNNNYGMAEQIEHGKTGYLFDNAHQALEQLCHLIENPSKIEEIGTNAREYARMHFLDNVIIERMLEFIEK
jgi:glycosyltransferase involved in cell wall biosynthesis